ncbi:hypothetical protein MHU86_24559 [Fragilaria crotonensis]|nr:hypothetical protein MHU86_24559 [Fragilaria crotonensis]
MAPVVEMEAFMNEDVSFQTETEQKEVGAEDVPTNNGILSSDETYDAEDERRFVWFQKEVEQKKLEDLKFAKRMDAKQEEFPAENAKPAFDKKKDFKDKFRAGGGAKENWLDRFYQGQKCLCPPLHSRMEESKSTLMRGGGNRTPRQKG